MNADAIDYDRGTQLLIADLEAAPPSPKRDAILERARTTGYGSQVALYIHLLEAGLSELASNVSRSKYESECSSTAPAADGHR